MTADAIRIRYASGEPAEVGDHVVNDVWKSRVVEVVATFDRMAQWGVTEPGLMLKCVEAGYVYEPYQSTTWDAIQFLGRAKPTG